MDWDPRRYAQFGDHRSRPFFDLTGRIAAREPRNIVDLGCGPGLLTATLAERWPNARVLGLDSSAAMVAAARSLPCAPSNLEFEQGSIEDWVPAPDTDVVVSNAVLHWVPTHRDLLGQWLRALPAGAWLALQVPGNFAAPSHALMRDLAESPRWAPQLAGRLLVSDSSGEPADYLGILLDGGATADAWESTYLQLLSGQHAVLDWVRGTALRPVLDALDPADARKFEQDYSALVDHAYPPGRHGTVFPFRRVFAVGQKN